MKSNDHKKRLEAAYILLSQQTTTLEKFEKIQSLIKGIHPSLDKPLDEAAKAIGHLRKIETGDIALVGIEGLPTQTEQQKKRKKALLLLLTSWRDLRTEVKRVNDIYHTEGSVMEKAGSVAGATKGPWGLITAAAVAVVGIGALLAYLNLAAVSVSIRNTGCPTIDPASSLSLNLPGLKLPSEPITNGSEGIAVVPPFSFSVDATNGNTITLLILGMRFNYNLFGSNTNFVFNGESLGGKLTDIRLSSAKAHTLIVQCN